MVTLTNGAAFPGLILADTPAGVVFQVVHRSAGRPTVTLTTFFARKEVAGVRRLPAADRAALRDRLADLDPFGAGERARMDELALAPAPWLGRAGAGRRYQSDRFVLVSGAGDEVTRRAAVRLEQIYAAFARVLAPRAAGGRPTTVLLTGRAADYARLAGPVRNPAVYDPAANRVVCGTDLDALGADLAAARRHHKDQAAALDRYEAEVRRLYAKDPGDRDRFLEAVAKGREKVRLADRRNDAGFDRAARRAFALLYHEAFHSYTATWVYPPLPAADVRAGKGPGGLPRWLDEGLAQAFETAVVEAGELRADLPDADRLARAKRLLREPPGLVPAADLVRAGREAFVAAHAGQEAAADRAYLTAWAMTYYLTADRRLVGAAGFDAYLREVNGGGDPVAGFERWAGQDAAGFDRDLRDYLGRLRADGTAPRP